MYRSFVSLGRYTPKYFILFVAQFSFLINPMDRRASRAAVHVVARVGHDLLPKQKLFHYKSARLYEEQKHGTQGGIWCHMRRPGNLLVRVIH